MGLILSDFPHLSLSFDYEPCDEATRLENLQKLIQLKERYNMRKDIVFDIIRKRQLYNLDYIDQLFEQFEGKLFSDVAEVKSTIFVASLNSLEYSNRPFSKLIKDLFDRGYMIK